MSDRLAEIKERVEPPIGIVTKFEEQLVADLRHLLTRLEAAEAVVETARYSEDPLVAQAIAAYDKAKQ